MSQNLRHYFDWMQSRLQTLARDGRSVQLKQELDAYRRLLECWLEVAPRRSLETVPFSFDKNAQPFAGPLEIDLFDVIRAANASGDVESFNVLIEAITGYLFRARQAEQLPMYAEFVQTLGFAYSLGTRNDVLRASSGGAVDRMLHAVLFDFNSRWRNPGVTSVSASTALFRNERPYLDVALSLTLSVISTAMEEGDERHARYFFDRLVEHRRYEQDHWNPDRKAPRVEDVDTLHDYATLTIAGWALHLLEQNYRSSRAAAENVLAAALKWLTERHELVALWELYHGGHAFEAPIDSRLGTRNWDLRDREEVRVGIAYTRSGGGEWRQRGLAAALIRGEEPSEWELKGFFEEPPPRHTWDAQRFEGLLRELATAEYLQVPEAKRAASVDSVIALIRSRQNEAESAYAQLAATAPLDSHRCEELAAEVARSMQKHREWIDAIRTLGGTVRAASFATPVGLSLGRLVPRDYLIPESNWGPGFGDWIGEQAAVWEAVQLVGLAEACAERGDPVASLAELGSAVREARRVLVDRGCTPNLLVLPAQDRFAGALFRKPLWQVEERREFGSIGYGTWEGLHVLRYPYNDPRSIIIADASRFFGVIGDKPTGIEVPIRELTPEEAKELVLKRSEAGPKSETSHPEARVLVTVRARPLLGVAIGEGEATPSAAIALDIRKSDGGYAMVPGEPLYHRPSCNVIEFEEDVSYSLVKRLVNEETDRQPCQVCHPERWNSEGRTGSVGKNAGEA